MPTRIYVTGRVYIETAGRVIEEQEFPGRQGRLLFVYLICHRNRPMTREELAEVLWGESLPRAWDAALSALVSKLRALLKDVGPDAISLESAFGSYLLRSKGDVWVDREAAAGALDEAEAFLRAGDWQKAFPVCHIASITARQPFLPGEDAAWIERERAALRRILVRSLEAASEVWLANGEPRHAIENAAEAVELEPFREIGYQRLMRLHQGIGNRAEALRVYDRCRTLLADELGADPSPETQALYLELLGAP